jgi:hypothetical protein
MLVQYVVGKVIVCGTRPGHQLSRTLQPSALDRVRVRFCRSVPGSSQVSPIASLIFGKAWIILVIPYEASMSAKSSGTPKLAFALPRGYNRVAYCLGKFADLH